MSTQTEAVGPNAMLEEAEIRYQEVRHRIGSGDPDVTPRDLEEAESALRFARTRLEAAGELERKREEQARQARIAEVRASLPKVFDLTAHDKARQNLEEALDLYCQEAEALQDRVSVVWNEVAGLGPGSGMTADSSSGEIRVGGTTYRRPLPQYVVGQLARETLRRHFPYTPIQLDRT